MPIVINREDTPVLLEMCDKEAETMINEIRQLKDARDRFISLIEEYNSTDYADVIENVWKPALDSAKAGIGTRYRRLNAVNRIRGQIMETTEGDIGAD